MFSFEVSPRTYLQGPLAILCLLFFSGCDSDSTLLATPGAAPANLPAAASVEPLPNDALQVQVSRMASIESASNPSFSPDGQELAYVAPYEGVPQVWVGAVDGSSLVPVTRFRDQVTDVSWGPENTGDARELALLLAPGGGLNSQIYLLSLEDGEARRITDGGTVNNWLGEWSQDGRYLGFSSNADGGTGMDCWSHDTKTGKNTLLLENDGIGKCRLSPDNSNLVAWRMASRGDTNLYLVNLLSGEEQLLTPHTGAAISDEASWLDNRSLLFATNIEREMMALARIDIDSQGKAQPLSIVTGRDDAELSELAALDPSRAALLWNVAGRSELNYYNLSTGDIVQGPELPAEVASQLSGNSSGTGLALRLTGPAAPADVWSLDIEDAAFSKISATTHEGVDLASLVRPELRRYPAHDELELSGWLYPAPGAEQPGALVLSFHGGPEGQARPYFRPVFQALLARGISVFDANVRGSSGFGKTFVNLDNGALRSDGIRDIEATARFLTEAGLADPARLGIMGGSYGGYMVMAGLSEYPQLFAAGANLFGVVNFQTFFANTEPWMAAISTVEYGDPVKDAGLLARLSPINKVDRVLAPTIVLHGANDTNVPVIEAQQVVDNLRTRGIPVEYVLFPDEGHGWRKTKNRVTSDVAIVRWFEQHLR